MHAEPETLAPTDTGSALTGSSILGTGSHLPPPTLTNETLAERFGVTPEWILTRTGIARRTVADPLVGTADLATGAARKALAAAGVDAERIDLIIVATVTPDHAMPSVACRVQDALGCTHAFAFDLSAACTGFLAGFEAARQYLISGRCEHVLLIGADTMTRITDPDDRATSILFADGAGAVVLGPTDGGDLPFALHADGSRHGDLYTGPRGEDDPNLGITMNGRAIFEAAVRSMSRAIAEVAARAGVDLDDLDWLVLHQANARILAAVARELDVAEERMINVLDDTGNSGAATLPVALDLAVRDGRIRRGHAVAMAAVGAGLTWGATVFRY